MRVVAARKLRASLSWRVAMRRAYASAVTVMQRIAAHVAKPIMKRWSAAWCWRCSLFNMKTSELGDLLPGLAVIDIASIPWMENRPMERAS
jgi:hypothetical protein